MVAGGRPEVRSGGVRNFGWERAWNLTKLGVSPRTVVVGALSVVAHVSGKSTDKNAKRVVELPGMCVALDPKLCLLDRPAPGGYPCGRQKCTV